VPARLIRTLHLDDLVLLVAKCLSGFTHFVILVPCQFKSGDARAPSGPGGGGGSGAQVHYEQTVRGRASGHGGGCGRGVPVHYDQTVRTPCEAPPGACVGVRVIVPATHYSPRHSPHFVERVKRHPTSMTRRELSVRPDRVEQDDEVRPALALVRQTGIERRLRPRPAHTAWQILPATSQATNKLKGKRAQISFDEMASNIWQILPATSQASHKLKEQGLRLCLMKWRAISARPCPRTRRTSHPSKCPRAKAWQILPATSSTRILNTCFLSSTVCCDKVRETTEILYSK